MLDISSKSMLRTVLGSCAFLALACTSGGGTVGGTGGRGAGTGGQTSSTGGSSSSGGSPGSGGSASGGAPGSGGSSTGGSGSGGMGTGGAATGGSSGSGGDPGGSGGEGTGGRTGIGGGAGGGGMAGRGSGGAGGNTGNGGNTPADGGVGDVVIHDGSVTTDGGAFVRGGWTATYTCTGTCPAQSAADTADVATTNAFDGNLGTRWSTGQYQSSTALKSKFPLYFTVDMKDVMNVSKLTMHPGTKDAFDAPGTIDVFLSIDGVNFGSAVVTAHKPPSAGGTDTITFTQTPARYIQLKATMTLQQVTPSAGDRYWAIGEMNVYP